jgi:virulence-associated protein VagC
MNNELSKFIVNTFEKEADVIIEPENDEIKSIESCNIVFEEANMDSRDSRFEKGESTLRNSRTEKQKSSILLPISNGFTNS